MRANSAQRRRGSRRRRSALRSFVTVLQISVLLSMGVLAGLVLGGSQAASRALQCLLTPVSHAAEFFGFFAISGRFASIFGPLSYGLLIYLTGSLRWGILSVAVFFIIGAIILLQVDEKAGMAEKAGYEEQLSSNMGITS